MTIYGQTYLQLVNKVLARMREASVATVTETTYSTLIGNLMNQVKSEIEQAFPWNALRDTYAINTVAGTSSYAFTDAGPDAKVLGDTGWDTTTPDLVRRGTNAQFDSNFFGVTSAAVESGPPKYFVPAGVDANYDLKIDVWPVPDAVYALKFNVYVPQAELTNGSDIPLIPQSLLVEETVARAMIERGDEMAPKPPMPGSTFILTDLLASEIAREDGHDPMEQDWETE